ncbi:MAG TPA: hypothetical protein VFJ17_06120 [Mycobacteriales bacterium]|jgi:hypothetical protein|nr:hypothetical protein [Mycobacteriales bacterium]
MRQSGSRYWAWTGIAFFALFAFSIFFLNGSTPGEKASAQTVMHYYNTHHGRTTADALLAPLIVALGAIYFTYLRARAREARATSDIGPTTMLVGAVIWAMGALVGSVIELTVSSASWHQQAQIAQTANVLSNDSWIPFIAGAATMLIGAGVTVLQSSLLPKWMGYVAIVAGVASLVGPGGFLGFIVAPLFVLTSAVMMLMRREIDVTTTAAATVPAQATAEAPTAKV